MSKVTANTRTRPPRLAILSPVYRNPQNPFKGGISTVVLNLARNFAARGIKIDLLVRQLKDHKKTPENLPEGIRIIDLDTHNKLSTAFSVARYLKREKPDTLLSAGHRFNISAAWASKLTRTSRVVLRVGNPMSREAMEEGRWHWWRRMREISLFFNWADGIVAISEGVADDLRANTGLRKEKIKVIYNPIASPDLIEKSRDPIDHPWFVPQGPPVILGVGRLAKQKGFDVLLRAFALVRAQLNCRLLILGEGPERASLKDLANSLQVSTDVHLPGFIENPFPYMKQAAVFVLSSIYEGFGNVLVEALTVGTPVVSTNCAGGPSEILRGGQVGPLVPPGDRDELAGAILKTMEKPPDPMMLREAARPFLIEVIADQYLQFLELAAPETIGINDR